MKSLLLLTTLVIATVFTARAESKLIAYPTADEAKFTIEIPGDWEIEQAEQDGDFFHVKGPTGAVFAFRTIQGSEDSLADAIKDSLTEINERFTDVQMGDAQDWTPGGLAGFYATGTGKDSEGPVTIGVAWADLKNGEIAEVWFVGDSTDKPGLKIAEDIANSLKAP